MTTIGTPIGRFTQTTTATVAIKHNPHIKRVLHGRSQPLLNLSLAVEPRWQDTHTSHQRTTMLQRVVPPTIRIVGCYSACCLRLWRSDCTGTTLLNYRYTAGTVLLQYKNADCQTFIYWIIPTHEYWYSSNSTPVLDYDTVSWFDMIKLQFFWITSHVTNIQWEGPTVVTAGPFAYYMRPQCLRVLWPWKKHLIQIFT